jgi:TolA-binding protein
MAASAILKLNVSTTKTKMTQSAKATWSRVKKEMDLPRVAMSARKAMLLLAKFRAAFPDLGIHN